MKKITIITVTFNCVDSIRSTLESVSRLNTERYEHIVIDGASLDGTIEVINEYKNRLSYFISESDKGIFYAMNKGYLRATGEYILFLNAGDIIDDGFDLKEEDLSDGNDIIYFSYKIKGDGTIYEPGIHHPFGLPTSHQATLIHRKVFKSYLFNTEYRVAADFNQYILIKNNPEIKHQYFKRVLSIVLPGGFSCENKSQMIGEYCKIIKINKGYFMWFAYLIWKSQTYKYINTIFRKEFSKILRIII